jgi:hypothetical protein
MATWQADFHFRLAAADLPDDYQARFRFDLREWKPNLYTNFIECVRHIGGELVATSGESVPHAFLESLADDDAQP